MEDYRDPFSSDAAADEIFLESAYAIALYNVSPILPGHSLVVPKMPVTSIFDLSNDEFIDFMLLCRRATALLCHAFGARAYNWTLQAGDAAGQTVRHLHMHLIPRSRADLPQPGDWYPLLVEVEKSHSKGRRRRLRGADMKSIVITLRKLARPDSASE